MVNTVYSKLDCGGGSGREIKLRLLMHVHIIKRRFPSCIQ